MDSQGNLPPVNCAPEARFRRNLCFDDTSIQNWIRWCVSGACWHGTEYV